LVLAQPKDIVSSGRQPFPKTRRGRLSAAGFVARRNLTGELRRWVVSALGLGVAVMMVLFLAGVVQWVQGSTTAYVRHSHAQLIVTQRGVDNLLLAQATLPITALDAVARLDGVARVTPIATLSGIVGAGSTKLPIFLIGHPAGRDGPWDLVSGRDAQTDGQVVIDRGLATGLGVGVGDQVTIVGRQLRVTGLSGGTNAAGIFFCFVPIQTAQAILGAETASYGLVNLRDGTTPAKAAEAIDSLGDVHAITPAALAHNDRKMIDASFAQPIEIMLVICYVIGLLIAAIVLYTSTIEHARDYAVLKALGARMRFLCTTAILGSLMLTACGFLIGWGLATILATALDTWRPVLESHLGSGIVLKTFLLVVIVNLLATLPPILHLRRIDPQEVFKA
jgi:putative ABC transport system permease protein